MGEYAEMAREQELAAMFGDCFNLGLPRKPGKFVLHRKANDKFWMKRNGRVVAMTQMASSHIRNCLSLLDRAGQRNTKAYEGLWAELNSRPDTEIKHDDETNSGGM